MSKKILSREVRVGIAFVLTIACIIFGVNYLKGINIFAPTNVYHAQYDRLNGLVVSNNVVVNGYKVGQVTHIEYDFSRKHPFVITILVDDGIVLPLGSTMNLADDGLLGGKVIDLVYGNSSEFYAPGDTISSAIMPGVMDMMSQLVPRLEGTISRVDSVLEAVNTVVSSKELKNSLRSIERTTADLQVTSANLKTLMNTKVPTIVDNVNTITVDLKKVSSDLNKIQFAELFTRIDRTVNNLQIFSEKINSNEGTIGKLLNDKSMYDNINTTVTSVNNLVVDLKENPKRYVHFSLFGAKDKKEKATNK